MRLARSAGMAALASLLVATAAGASRPATSDELSKMDSQGGQVPACSTAIVSTIDPMFGRLVSTNAAGCSGDEGLYSVQERRGPGWFFLGNVPKKLQGCPLRNVPLSTPVAKDLKLCRNPKAFLLCLPRKSLGPDRVTKVKPRRCSTLAIGDPYSKAANLTRVRWRRWGRRVARGRGIDRRFFSPHPRIRVRLKAYRRRRVCNGDYLYTRLKVRSRRVTRTIKFPRACGDANAARAARAHAVQARAAR
jgi:hypothetical protein